MTMLSINTNVGALQAARSSYSVNKSMETSMERMASGKRINSAADDAANLAISTRITAEIQGLKQSVKNAADAQSLLNVTEGALSEVHTILLRMRELAVQSANETVRDQDRDMLQMEVAQLEAEIQRISDDTTWSGMTLLASRLNRDLESGATFQIGPRDTDVITISIAAIDATQTERLALNSHVSTQAAAQDYIVTIDNAISKISEQRGKYGAVMNRLDHAMANMQNIVTNLSTAKGRLEDADFAAESANLARTQVLQQASMAMLSQANASKQNILALFQ